MYLIVILFFCCNKFICSTSYYKKYESRLVTHQGVEFIGELKDKNNDLYLFKIGKIRVIYLDGKIYISNLNFNVLKIHLKVELIEIKCFLYKTQ